MIPTLHPLAASIKRWRSTPDGEEAEMSKEEAAQNASSSPTHQSLWWEVRNYSSAMYMTDRIPEALKFAERALAMKRTISTLHNMAIILDVYGRYDEALDYALEAARMDPLDDRATSCASEFLLRAGHFAEGWPLYRRNRAAMDWAKLFIPEWEGPHQDIKGKRILIFEGGGYGDNFYFMRWLDTLRHWGADIHYVCNPNLASLARRQGFHAIENWHGNADIHWEQYSYFCPLLSLAGKLGVTLTNYKWRGPYIKAQRRLPWPTHRIGICRRAGEATSQRKWRSLHDRQADRILFSLPKKYHWVNLTAACPIENIENPQLDNWLTTANIMSQLDLVVTVDTGVAHLAGAMGIPCLVMLPGQSAWHYPLGYDCHPLYPSMRIFRNRGEGLDSAVKDVADSLKIL